MCSEACHRPTTGLSHFAWIRINANPQHLCLPSSKEELEYYYKKFTGLFTTEIGDRGRARLQLERCLWANVKDDQVFDVPYGVHTSYQDSVIHQTCCIADQHIHPYSPQIPSRGCSSSCKITFSPKSLQSTNPSIARNRYGVAEDEVWSLENEAESLEI